VVRGLNVFCGGLLIGAGAWRGKESGEKWLPRGDHEEGDRLLAFLIARTGYLDREVDLVNYLGAVA
jgi:hypothetical protein